MVGLWSDTPGYWKTSDFPPPVGISTNVWFPVTTESIAFFWRGFTEECPQTDLRVSIISSQQLTFPDGSTGTVICVSCSVKDIAAVSDEMSRSNSSGVSTTVDENCVNHFSTVSFRNMLTHSTSGSHLSFLFLHHTLNFVNWSWLLTVSIWCFPLNWFNLPLTIRIQ